MMQQGKSKGESVRNKLGRLISSLSKEQKRYVRRWLSTHYPNNRIVKVYDYLVKHPMASHKQVKNHFAKEGWSAQLSVVKHNLYKAIIEALSERSDGDFLLPQETWDVLMEIKTLINQKMWSDAIAEIEKNLIKGIREGNQFLVLGLLHLSLRLHGASDFAYVKKSVLEQFSDAMNWLESDVSVWMHNAYGFLRAFSLYKQKGKGLKDEGGIKQEYENIQESLKKPQKHSSFGALYLYSQTRLLLSGVFDKYDEILDEVKEFESFIISDRFFNKYSIPISSYLLNSLVTLAEQGKINEAKKVFDLLSDLYNKTLTDSSLKSITVHRNFVFAILYLAEYTGNISLIETNNNVIIELLRMLPDVDWQKAYVYFTVGKMYVYEQDYNKALDYLSFFEGVGKNTIAKDLKAFSFLLKTIVHFEQGSISEMEKNLKKAWYYLEKEDMISEDLRAVLNLLGRCRFRDPKETELMDIYDKVKHDRTLCRYFDFPKWLKKHIDRSGNVGAVQD